MSVPSSSPADTQAPVKEKKKCHYDLSQMQPWREFAVVLCDDDEHSMDEVVFQIIKALQCSLQRAQEIMMKAHQSGRATVIIASRARATQVAGILRQINLDVLMRQIN